MKELSTASHKANLEYYQVQYAKAVAKAAILDSQLAKAELLVERLDQEMHIDIAAELHKRLQEKHT